MAEDTTVEVRPLALGTKRRTRVMYLSGMSIYVVPSSVPSHPIALFRFDLRAVFGRDQPGSSSGTRARVSNAVTALEDG
eukprot:3205416-Pyramimonas_sp.AAC.1